MDKLQRRLRMNGKQAKKLRRAAEQATMRDVWKVWVKVSGGKEYSAYRMQQRQNLPNFRNIMLRHECTRATYQRMKHDYLIGLRT